MKIPLPILIILLVCSCQNSKKSIDLSLRDKPFISFEEFYKTAFDSSEPKIPLCIPFSYNHLTSLDQIDSLSMYLCNNNIVDCSGCISLRYQYKRDTIYIPAFNVNCNCDVVGLLPVTRIELFLKADTIYFKNLFSTRMTNLEEIRDSLSTNFSKTISDFCSVMTKRKPFFNNPDSLKKYLYVNNSYRRLLLIKLSDDTQIKHLNNLIDIAYETYLQQLRITIPNTYKSSLNSLDEFEYKVFVRSLFFPINIIKDISGEYIPPIKIN